MIRRFLQRLLLSPLLHCLWLGLALLWISAEPEPKPVIRISEQQVKDLQVQWELQTGRPPNEDRTRLLIDASIENEVLFQEAMKRNYDQLPVVKNRLQQLGDFLKLSDGDARDKEREALKLGLEQTDPLIRRYVVASLRETLTLALPVEEPSSEDIQYFYDTHKESYLQQPRIQVSHAYFGGLTENSLIRAEMLLAELPDSVDTVVRSGDPFYNGHHLPLLNLRELSKRLGETFAEEVIAQQESGKWLGPFASSFGYHLVYVHERKAAYYQPLAEVEANIRSQLIRERRTQNLKRQVAELKQDYVIEVADINDNASGIVMPDFSSGRSLL